MDVFFTVYGDRFVWDSDKAASNLLKHGVSFDRALEVFLDPLHSLSDAGVTGEKRLAALGLEQNQNRFRKTGRCR